MPLSGPIVRATPIAGLDKFLSRHGVDSDALFSRFGLRPVAPGRENDEVPFLAVTQLLEQAAIISGDPCIGLSWAEEFPFGGTGVLAYLVAYSSCVDEAMQTLTRFVDLLRNPAQAHFDHDSDGAVFWWRWLPSVEKPPIQYSALMLSLPLLRLRGLTATPWEPTLVELQTPPFKCADKIERIFGHNVRYGADRNAIRFDRATLDLPIVRSDPNLLPLLLKLAGQMLTALPIKDDVATITANAIVPLLPERNATLDVVAGQLGYSPRGLQSRLAQASTSFEFILNEVRKARATHLLRDTNLPLTEIALRLGFSELSAFTRASRRWFNCAPSTMRAKLRSGTPAPGA
ncbi:MAG: AraC family transcriptional regulator ligand-binding domain-containing protein [Hyphomicrobium sp.]